MTVSRIRSGLASAARAAQPFAADLTPARAAASDSAAPADVQNPTRQAHGYVGTNHHVVANAEKVTVILQGSPIKKSGRAIGVQAGDGIGSVDRKPVTTPQQAAVALKEPAKTSTSRC